MNKEIEIDIANVTAPLSEKLYGFRLIGQNRGKFTKISSKVFLYNFLDITLKRQK